MLQATRRGLRPGWPPVRGAILATLGLLVAASAGPSLAASVSANWLSAADGDWDVASNWSTDPIIPNNGFPNPADGYDVTIDAAGAPYQVSLTTPVTIDNFTLNSEDATVWAGNATVSLTGSAELEAGRLRVVQGITGGTWNTTGGTIEFLGPSPIIVGATVNGDVEVDTFGTGALAVGSTFTGTVEVARGSSFWILDTRTLDDVTVNLGGFSNTNYENFGTAGTSTLTLGPNAQVNLLGHESRLASAPSPPGTSTIVNHGTIVGDHYISRVIPDNFINHGTMTSQNRGSLHIGSDEGTFTNDVTGVISASARSTLFFGGSWTNQGTVELTDSTLLLDGVFRPSDIGTLDRSGATEVLIRGHLENPDDTLALDASTGTFTMWGGTVTGGTVTQADGATLTFGYLSDGTLDGVLVVGDLDLMISAAEARLVNGSTFTGAANIGSSDLIVDQFTIEPYNRINMLGSSILTTDSTLGGTGIVENLGHITADGGGFYQLPKITSEIFDNQGIVTTRNVGLLTVGCSTCSVRNLAGNTLAGGSWEVFENSRLTFFGDPALTVNQADILISGFNSSFVSAESIALNDTGASLRLLDGRDFAPGAAFTNRGFLILEGGEFDAAGLFSNETGAELQAFGDILGNMDNSGDLIPGLEASTGTLTIDGDLTLFSTSEVSFEIGGPMQGSQYDSIDASGEMALEGILSLSFLDGFESEVMAGATFTLLEANAPIAGLFANAAPGDQLPTSDGRGVFEVFYGSSSPFGADRVVASYVPEPGTLMLTGGGLIGLAWLGRRRQA